LQDDPQQMPDGTEGMFLFRQILFEVLLDLPQTHLLRHGDEPFIDADLVPLGPGPGIEIVEVMYLRRWLRTRERLLLLEKPFHTGALRGRRCFTEQLKHLVQPSSLRPPPFPHNRAGAARSFCAYSA
jgi:hypothetical protein